MVPLEHLTHFVTRRAHHFEDDDVDQRDSKYGRCAFQDRRQHQIEVVDVVISYGYEQQGLRCIDDGGRDH